jgi:hypothetical protein
LFSYLLKNLLGLPFGQLLKCASDLIFGPKGSAGITGLEWAAARFPFVRLLDELPEQWLRWIESNSPASRNSRVFTQTGKAALGLVRIPEHLLKRQEAKVCFWAFRRYTRPGMKVGWWQYEVANKLQRFYYRLKKGERPKLVLMAPPQHGKTEQVTDFIAWVAGKDPELKTIFASYSDELGADVNKALQRIMTSERYVSIFGVRLGESGSR